MHARIPNSIASYVYIASYVLKTRIVIYVWETCIPRDICVGKHAALVKCA